MDLLVLVLWLLWGSNFWNKPLSAFNTAVHRKFSRSELLDTQAVFVSVLGGDNQLLEEDFYSDDDNDEGSASIYEVQPAASPERWHSPSATHRPFLHLSSWVLKSISFMDI